tara:strand:+ start:2777 stop:2917 length:141 start_codon:yes stop_codon:yes gene_type:complete
MHPETDEQFEQMQIAVVNDKEIYWGADADEPLTCGIEDPDTCESCQ